jgi:hypothetical protein
MNDLVILDKEDKSFMNYAFELLILVITKNEIEYTPERT